jgi:hypothetical protein
MLKMKRSPNFLLILMLLGLIACSDKEPIRVTILPTIEGASLYFRGYVTINPEELSSDIYYFTRSFSHVDTLEGQPVYAFYSNDDQLYFYTDEAGTVRQLNTINLTNRLLAYSITTNKPINIAYWETLLKLDDGVGSQWQVLVDTTVTGIDSTGKPVQIRYFYSGKARYNGWSYTFIPENNKYERVLDVYWYEIDHSIVNETTGDSLFIKRGTGHHYFDPELGLIKYVTDYKKKEKNSFYISRHGTWELIRKEIPK